MESNRVDLDLNGEPFFARGNRVVTAGWLEYYPYSRQKDSELPLLQKGDRVRLVNKELEAKETQPPSRFGQGPLIELMEKHNLGTKATRHSIIQNLYDRGYVHGNPVEPTEMGIKMAEALQEFAPRIASPEMTAELEKDMDLISVRDLTKEQVVTISRDLLRQAYGSLEQNKEQMAAKIYEGITDDRILGECPKCGKNRIRVIRSKATKKRFVGCEGYPDCDQTYPLPAGRRPRHRGDLSAVRHSQGEGLGGPAPVGPVSRPQSPTKAEYREKRAARAAGAGAGGAARTKTGAARTTARTKTGANGDKSSARKTPPKPAARAGERRARLRPQPRLSPHHPSRVRPRVRLRPCCRKMPIWTTRPLELWEATCTVSSSLLKGWMGAANPPRWNCWPRDCGSGDTWYCSPGSPGGTPLGEAIRDLLLDPRHHGMSARAEALLYAAARAHLVEQVIRPALEDGQVVLCDRYLDSSLAYQGYGRGLGTDDIVTLNVWATECLFPDLTLLLDLDDSLRPARLAAVPDRLEAEDDEFHRRVAEGYRALSHSHPHRIRRIDADGTESAVQARVRTVVEEELKLFSH